MTTESDFQTKIKDFLNGLDGCKCIKHTITGGAVAGEPDLICSLRGHFLAIEVKKDNGVVSKLQERKLEEWRKTGALAFVVYPSGFEAFKSHIKAVLGIPILNPLNKSETEDINSIFDKYR